MSDIRSSVNAYFSNSLDQLRQTIDNLEGYCLEDVHTAIDVMVGSIRNQGRILVCGNGGSAADAQHFSGELVATLRKDVRRPAISAIALSNDISAITAYANDYSYSEVFSRQVEAHGRAGDSLVCISTSGSSKNILNAAAQARAQSVHVIAITGSAGHQLRNLSDVCIVIPARDTPIIQNAYQFLIHVLCFGIEHAVSGIEAPGPHS